MVQEQKNQASLKKMALPVKDKTSQDRTKLTVPKSQMETPSDREDEVPFQENLKKWDVYDEDAVEFDDIQENSVFQKLIKLLKLLVYLVTFLTILFCGVLSKSSLLFMTSVIRKTRALPYCQNPGGLNPKEQYEVEHSEQERYCWMWCLLFALFIPDVLTFIRSSRLCIFKKYKKPYLGSFLTVFVMETIHVLGLFFLVFMAFPQMNIMKALSFSNAVCLIPSLLNLFSSWKCSWSFSSVFKNFFGIIAFAFQATIFIYFTIICLQENKRNNEILVEVLSLVGLLLVSCSWWENFVSEDSLDFLKKTKEDIQNSRQFIYIFISLWKIVLTLGLCLFLLILSDEGEDKVRDFFKLKDIFAHHNASIVWLRHDVQILPNITNVEEKTIISYIKFNDYLPFIATIVHVLASYICYSCGKFVCKVCMQRFSFSLPLSLVVPVTMVLLRNVCFFKCDYLDMSPYLFGFCPDDSLSHFLIEEAGFLWIFWLISQIILTYHVWYPHCERMASTNKLFINPMYCTVFIDQSLVLNRRKYEKESCDREKMMASEESDETPENVTRIFACATMWHETPDEMEQLLKSIMRMDVHQCSQATIQDGFFIRNPDYYELQAHIFFDDAFVISDEDDNKRTINSFVKDFIDAVDTAASKVYKKCARPDPPMKVPTPYGGKLVWKLLGENFLVVHLKDKELIRHKKRWSQVMYMYYLLGYGLEYKMSENFSNFKSKENLRHNTFILALDGDIDFRPHAVQLLVDLMKRNKNLGAACGRIHPVGTGMMVYYQKFEYAIGHWLQKSTEHMIGCVLCSPGCFSLFRAEALLQKNTINTYSKQAKEAIEYVQFDQGEDRWLCTLLLQRGYRVEYSAASDAYTHCPETFAEFYTQRRRWAPSTMANIMDLLINYQKTVECNDNISRPYIAYQVLLMLGTILGPGTIFLMLVGALVTAFKISNNQALIANAIPIIFFILICFQTKNDIQIFVAQIFSALYALLMMAVLIAISIQLAIEGVTSPSGIFLLSMTASFVIAALAHPQEFWCVAHGIIYFLSVPSMYLLLALYSFINLNVVSWGTREVQTKKSKKQQEEERLKAQVVAQPKTKGGMFEWVNALSSKQNQSEEDGSISFSFANLFRCMCCTYPKPDQTTLQMVKIEMTLDNINERIKTLQNQVDTTVLKPPGMRRRSSLHGLKNDLKLQVLPEEDEESEEMDYSSDEQSSIHEQENQENREYWLSDPALKECAIKRLTDVEQEFWRQLIDTYLYPLKDNPDEKAKVSRQLIELRNKVVFGVLMLNALFILIVFLLQMQKDILHIEWPLNGKNKNITYIGRPLNIIRIDMEYLQLEPINLVLVFFFTLILVIQFIGMLFHRVETLSHILASTRLFSFHSEDTLDINFSKLTDLLRKQGLQDDDEPKMVENEEETTMPDHPNGIPRIFSPSPQENNVRKKKFRSLSLALEENLLKIIDKDPKFARAIRRKSRNPDALEALRIRQTLHRLGINTPHSVSRPPTPASVVSDLERLNFHWSNRGSIRSRRLLESVLDHSQENSDSISVTSIQMINQPASTSTSPIPVASNAASGIS